MTIIFRCPPAATALFLVDSLKADTACGYLVLLPFMAAMRFAGKGRLVFAQAEPLS